MNISLDTQWYAKRDHILKEQPLALLLLNILMCLDAEQPGVKKTKKQLASIMGVSPTRVENHLRLLTDGGAIRVRESEKLGILSITLLDEQVVKTDGLDADDFDEAYWLEQVKQGYARWELRAAEVLTAQGGNYDRTLKQVSRWYFIARNQPSIAQVLISLQAYLDATEDWQPTNPFAYWRKLVSEVETYQDRYTLNGLDPKPEKKQKATWGEAL